MIYLYYLLLISDNSQYTYCDISGATLPGDCREPVITVENNYIAACLFTSATGEEFYSCIVSPLPTQGSSNPTLTWTETSLTTTSGAGTDSAIEKLAAHTLS